MPSLFRIRERIGIQTRRSATDSNEKIRAYTDAIDRSSPHLTTAQTSVLATVSTTSTTAASSQRPSDDLEASAVIKDNPAYQDALQKHVDTLEDEEKDFFKTAYITLPADPSPRKSQPV